MNKKEFFIELKNQSVPNRYTFCLPIGNPIEAIIRPIPTSKVNSQSVDVKLLTEWRNKYVKSFLTEFVATEKQTAHWLKEIVHPNESKILLMVELLDGTAVGHIGLGFINWDESYGEADAIVSNGASPKGLMKQSLIALLRWAHYELGLNNLCVRVRSDNPAIEFYKKVGFIEFKRVGLKCNQTEGNLNWSEDINLKDPLVSLVYMDYDCSLL